MGKINFNTSYVVIKREDTTEPDNEGWLFQYILCCY